MIKVVLADEDAVVREGLRTAINAQPDGEIEVVGETSSTTEMLQLVEVSRPNVVVMDALLPDADVFDIIRQIQAQPEPPRIVISSTFGEAGKVFEILREGVSGYCLRCDGSHPVLVAIRTAAEGVPCASPTMCHRLLDFVDEALKPLPPDITFTEREREVLKLLAKGPMRKELASTLGIADSTVRDHLNSIGEKTGLATREQKIAFTAKYRFDLR